jgi:hypothetical protein
MSTRRPFASLTLLSALTLSFCRSRGGLPGEFFFLRRDGRISGRHRDCALPADCPDGSSCKSIGTAPGGPVEEQFCE